MTEQKNVFEELTDKGICYCVGVALITTKIKDTGKVGRDHYIIASLKDKDRLYGLKFYNSKSNNFTTIEKTLTREEITIFKTMQDQFVKVLHNSEGKIYELKNNSFRTYYNEN